MHPPFLAKGGAIIVAFTVLKLKSKKYKAIDLHYHRDKNEKICKYFVVELDENGNEIFKFYGKKIQWEGVYITQILERLML